MAVCIDITVVMSGVLKAVCISVTGSYVRVIWLSLTESCVRWVSQ